MKSYNLCNYRDFKQFVTVDTNTLLGKQFVFGSYRIPYRLKMPWTENIREFTDYIVSLHEKLDKDCNVFGC